MYVVHGYAMCAWVHVEAKAGLQICWNGSQNGYEQPDVNVGNQTRVIWKSRVHYQPWGHSPASILYVLSNLQVTHIAQSNINAMGGVTVYYLENDYWKNYCICSI